MRPLPQQRRTSAFIFLLVISTVLLRGSFAQADEIAELLAQAEQGDAQAQTRLGDHYLLGLGIRQEAAKWYRRAAHQGDAAAFNNLGVMYGKGQGVVQDYVQAHKWLNLAAAYLTGADRDRAATNRDIVEAKMTPAQVAEAKELAREWRQKIK